MRATPTAGSGLAHYADMGKTSQGVINFDLTPSQGYIGSISGSYNSSSGVFSWVTKYSDYFLVSESVEGYGGIYPNGAADRSTWRAPSTSSMMAGRAPGEERYGCEGYQQVWTEHEAEEEGESDWSLNSELDYTILSPDEVSFFWEGDGLKRDGAWRSDYSDVDRGPLDGSWQSDSQRDAAGQLTEDFVLETSYRYEGASP